MDLDPHLPIKLRQMKMSEKYKDKKPNKIKKIAWIYAVNQKHNYPVDTIRSGKYLLFTNLEDVNVVWTLIKKATIDGLLGDTSKVSTLSQRKQHGDRQHVICIYTYDRDDWVDRRRIETNLSQLGFTQLSYKTNAKTLTRRHI